MKLTLLTKLAVLTSVNPSNDPHAQNILYENLSRDNIDAAIDELIEIIDFVRENHHQLKSEALLAKHFMNDQDAGEAIGFDLEDHNELWGEGEGSYRKKRSLGFKVIGDEIKEVMITARDSNDDIDF